MRVKPLTSFLSHKGRGCRSLKRDESLSLGVKKLIKHTLGPSAGQREDRDSSRAASSNRSTVSRGGPSVPGKASPVFPKQW